MSGGLEAERRSDLLIATINNPGCLNALSVDVLQGLERLVDELEKTVDIRVVVLTASGSQAFCSGTDTEASGGLGGIEFSRNRITSGHCLLDRLARVTVPVIAAINGDVMGGGLELVAACDMRISRPDAVFSLPETGTGVTPGWSGMQRVMRLMPEPVLREMALTCQQMPAGRLHAVGFINELADDPCARALEVAAGIEVLAPRLVSVNKQLLNAEAGEGHEAAIDWLAAGFVDKTSGKLQGIRGKRPRKSGDA